MVADEGDHVFRLGAGAAVAQGRGQQGAGGGAAHDAFLAQQFPGGGEALGVGHGVGLAHPGEVADGGDEILADAFHQPGAGLLDVAVGHVVGQHGAGRIGQHHLHPGRFLAEEAGQAGEGAAAADAADHGVDAAFQLGPQFRPGAGLVGLGIVGVAELVHIPGAGNLAGQALGHVLVVLGMADAHVGAGHHHPGPQGLQGEDLFLAHLVRHHQHHLVTALGTHQGEGQTGVAGGGLHQGGAGLDQAFLLGGVDHGTGHPVLDGAARILAFQLEEETAGAGVEVGHFHQGGGPDQVQAGAGQGGGRSEGGGGIGHGISVRLEDEGGRRGQVEMGAGPGRGAVAGCGSHGAPGMSPTVIPSRFLQKE